jgi:hypothetical protein
VSFRGTEAGNNLHLALFNSLRPAELPAQNIADRFNGIDGRFGVKNNRDYDLVNGRSFVRLSRKSLGG